MALGDAGARLLGMEQGRDGRHVERRFHAVPVEQGADARYADPAAVFAPAQPADRLAAGAQLVGLMLGIERRRRGAARAVCPRGGPIALAGTHLLHQIAPMLLTPLPGFELLRGVRV